VVSVDEEGNTPGHRALESTTKRTILQPGTSWSVVNLLLDCGASISCANERGDTLLHLAAKQGAVKIMKNLLSKGVDANVRNLFNQTPLHYAVEFGAGESIKLLLAHVSRIINCS
jgi:ankyrin repeat protein